MNSTTLSAPSATGKASWLRNFPISFFAVVMGLEGLTLAWRKAEVVFIPPFAVSCLVQPVTVLVFALLGAVYLLKIVRHPDGVVEELNHPIKLNFFSTVPIGLVLLSIASMDGNPITARWLWISGTVLQFGLTLYVMTVWIHHTKFEVAHINPAWFLPVVGNIIIPIAGVRFYSPEISWFFFSVGLVFWIVLFTIVMYRLFFHTPLPARLMPTHFILIAPPAAGFISYVSLTGMVDAFARILYYVALMLTLLLASNAIRFLKAKFFLSAWAYSFPLAAMTIATLIMTQQLRRAAFEWISIGLLGILTLIVTALFLRTLMALGRHEICVEEE